MKIRSACREDVSAIIEIYIADPLTGPRESREIPLPGIYYDAFERMQGDANQLLLVAEDAGKVVGTLQISFIQHLLFQGMRRAILEAIFVHPSHHSAGVGSALVQFAIEQARAAGCQSVELTSNKARSRAHAFYQRLGFQATHEGFKLLLQK